MLSLYYHKISPVHRLGAGWKLMILLSLSAAFFAIKNPLILLITFILVLSSYAVARISLLFVFNQVKPLVPLMAIIFTVQVFVSNWSGAGAITLRFFTLMLAASLLTFTTRLSEIVARVERLLTPFSRWVDIDKLSLAFSLTLRFIPYLIVLARQVREAQQARGMKPTVFSVAFPLVVKVFKIGDAIAEAIEMRSFQKFR